MTEFPDAHATPVAAELSAVRTRVFDPTARAEGFPEPAPIRIPPLGDRSTAPTALVPFPISTPLAVNVVAPVPPLPTGRVPVTPFATLTCAHAGLLSVPVLDR